MRVGEVKGPFPSWSIRQGRPKIIRMTRRAKDLLQGLEIVCEFLNRRLRQGVEERQGDIPLAVEKVT